MKYETFLNLTYYKGKSQSSTYQISLCQKLHVWDTMPAVCKGLLEVNKLRPVYTQNMADFRCVWSMASGNQSAVYHGTWFMGCSSPVWTEVPTETVMINAFV